MKRRHLLATAPFAIATLGTSLALRAQGFDPTGRFTLIEPPQPTETPGKVEVVDVFWYGCPHCYAFLPYMEKWMERRADYIAVRRMPAILRDSWENHARAFYVAQQLGIAELLHRPIFDAIHLDGLRLDTQEGIAKFFAERAGVSTDKFNAAWGSFTVQTLLQKSRVMQRNYRVRGTPSVVIAGKYLTSGSQAGSYPELLKVVDALAAMEHKAIS